MPRINIAALPALSPLSPLGRRQVVVSSDGDGDGGDRLSGGAIAGIVIGSVAGFLLLLWILRSCTNIGAPPAEPWHDDGPRRHNRHKRRSRSHYYRESYPVRALSRRYSTEIPIATAERISVTEPVWLCAATRVTAMATVPSGHRLGLEQPTLWKRPQQRQAAADTSRHMSVLRFLGTFTVPKVNPTRTAIDTGKHGIPSALP